MISPLAARRGTFVEVDEGERMIDEDVSPWKLGAFLAPSRK